MYDHGQKIGLGLWCLT